MYTSIIVRNLHIIKEILSRIVSPSSPQNHLFANPYTFYLDDLSLLKKCPQPSRLPTPPSPTTPVILSAEMPSRREGIPQSEDPYMPIDPRCNRAAPASHLLACWDYFGPRQR